MNSVPYPDIDSGVRPNRATLEKRWASVDDIRHELASELAKVGTLIGGIEKRQIMSWSDWFRAEHDLDDALVRPDIMSIVTPIFEQATDNKVTATDISGIAQQSFQLVNFNHSISRRMWKIVQYPVAIVSLLSLLWLCFTLTLAPELREVFASFEIEFSLVSRLTLGGMPHLHILSWVLSAAVLIVATTLLVTNWRHSSNPPNSTWLDKRLMTTRHAVGIWAWHISLLIRAGIDSAEAVAIASRATTNNWVKTRAKQWLQAAKSNPTGAVACLGPFDNSPFQMANSAVVMPDPNKKSSLLHQTAIYYNDRARVVGDWWFRILAWLILWNAFLAGVIFFVTLYGSLYSIMRGLLYWW